MINIQLHNPDWINKGLLKYSSLEEVPASVLNGIRERLKNAVSNKPKVSICIAAWNEELNIIRCLDSLSYTEMDVDFEILVVNNNSTDKTQEVLDLLEVQSYFQPIQGCGAAREMSQRKAKGDYILLADADCIYPKSWANTMYKNLTQEGVVAVYGRHSFLGDGKNPRWQYALYEGGKKIVSKIRHFKYPYLNAYGMSLGYIKELGLKEGFDMRNIRGEDGRLCFDLMKYGKIKAVNNPHSLIWTEERNFNKDGGFSKALKKRFLIETTRFLKYFKSPERHDTKTSKNTDLPKAFKSRK